jgi:hypothetical protein
VKILDFAKFDFKLCIHFCLLSFSLDVSSQIGMYLEESFVICKYVIMDERDENCLVPSENIL